MSVIHEKLHVVLKAKANHAEFTCFLCRKLFISAYHLNRHKSRRHSKHLEQEQINIVPSISSHELNSQRHGCRAIDASQRMENLLRNLSFEETKFFSNKNLKASISCTDLVNTNDICMPNFSPLYFKSKNSEKNEKHKTHLRFTTFIANKENENRRVKDNFIYDKPLDIISNGNKKVSYKKYSNNKNSNGRKRMHSKRQVLKEQGCQVNMSDLRDTSNCKCWLTTKAIDENISSPSHYSVNIPSCSTPIKSKESLLMLNISTQTEGINSNDTENFTLQKSRLENLSIDNNVKSEELRKSCSEDLFVNNVADDDDSNIQRIVPTLKSIENNAYSGDYTLESVNNTIKNNRFRNLIGVHLFIPHDNEAFEKEFRESFEARKSLLDQNDYLCENTKEVGHSMSIENKTESNQILGVQFGNERIEEKPNDIKDDTSLSSSDNSSESSELLNDQHGNLESFEERQKRYREIIENKLSLKLRKLGVDPNWTHLKDKTSEKINSLLTLKRIKWSKEIPEFTTVRTMLNNTVDQILESKVAG